MGLFTRRSKMERKRVLFMLTLAFGVSFNGVHSDENNTDTPLEARVLVLGAGMSGISAVRTLQEAGEEDFLLLEAADHVGGRTKQGHIGGYSVETGSNWIQGTYRNKGDSNNPILEYALGMNLSLALTNYDDWVVRNSSGHDVTEQADLAYERFAPALYAANNLSLKMQTGGQPCESLPDLNFQAALRAQGWAPQDPIDWAVEFFDVDFTTGNPAKQSSLKFYFDWSFYNYEDEDLLVLEQDNGGFSSLHQSLPDEAISENDSVNRLYLNTVVTGIEEVGDKVHVTTTSGQTFIGEYVIMTFSLGVLQRDVVTFTPALPGWKLDAIHSFDLSSYYIIYLHFPSAFWDDVEWIVYAGDRRGYFTLWQNLNVKRPGSNLLQVTVMGQEALNLEQLTDAQVQAEAMGVLRSMYGPSIPEASEILFKRWGQDPLTYGSFANWPPGFEDWQREALKAPVGRVHFAGEAMNMMYGYLQGAYLSGQESAQQVATCLRRPRSCRKPYVPPYEARGCTYDDADNYDRQAQVDDGSCVFSGVSSATGSHTACVYPGLLLSLLTAVCKMADLSM